MLTAILLILSLAGVSDPRPVGEQAWVADFSSSDGWRMQAATGQLDNSLRVGELSLMANKLVLIESPYRLQPPSSLILICRQLSGAPDARFGIWITADDSPTLVIGINSDTYVGILEPPPSTADPIRPWHVFPHVKKLGQPNKFQLDFNENLLTIWLNDERVTRIDYPSASLSVGLYAETFNEGAAFQFERLEGWQK